VESASEQINSETVPSFVKAYSKTFPTAGSSETAHSFTAYTTLDTSNAVNLTNEKYKCPICETEYDTAEERDNCAHQTGCPGYTVSHFSGENLTADTASDFTALTFESFPAGSISYRTGDDTVSSPYVYTPASTFDSLKNSGSEKFFITKDISVKIGGAVIYSNGDGKIPVFFKKSNSVIIDAVTGISFGGSSLSTNKTSDASTWVKGDAESIDVANLVNYAKIHASGAGTVTASVKLPKILDSDNSTEMTNIDTSAAAILFDKLGNILTYKSFKTFNSQSVVDFSTSVNEEMDVYLAFLKNGAEPVVTVSGTEKRRLGSLGINAFEFEAAEVTE
ncbi:MAG: hypothetical protein K5873_01175, partial [Treponema sp.]|nr:hypothetical protein [Treponema sp.]